MKNIIKEWITSTIGVGLLILSGFMFWYEKPLLSAVVAFGLGLTGLFMKDALVKVFLEGIKKLFK